MLRQFSSPSLCLLGAALLPSLTVAQETNFTTGVDITDGGDFFSADLFVEGGTVLDGATCIGNGCDDSQIFPLWATLQISSTTPHIEFRDDSTSSLPDRDWQITINANGGTQEYFAIEDLTESTTPFTIEGGAEENTLYVGRFGRVGVGTSLPTTELHIVDRTTPTIRLEQDGSSSASPLQVWDIIANHNNFYFRDSTSGTFPFVLDKGAMNYAINVESNGFVGLGTSSPDGKFHSAGTGTQVAYFESEDGGAVQMRFRSDSQNRRFLATNNADEVQTQLQFRDDEILLLGASSAEEWLSVSAAGITTAGPTCSPNPCDRTFDPEYFTVPAIEERAAYMWENMHLPAVGPTAPGIPFNLTDKMGGVIHELEVAHIYIEQLHTDLAKTRKDLAQTNELAKLMVAQVTELAAQVDLLKAQ